MDMQYKKQFAQQQEKFCQDAGFPLPWEPDPYSPWILRAANGRTVAVFTAWNDKLGALIIGEAHCRKVADLSRQYHYQQTVISGLEDEVDNLKGMLDNRQAGDAQLMIEAPTKNINDLRIIQRLVTLWADGQFPNRTPQQAFMKLFEEIGEVIRSPREAGEWADIFIMLVDLCQMYGITDIGQAIEDKMKVNSHRQWTASDTGTMQHNRDD